MHYEIEVREPGGHAGGEGDRHLASPGGRWRAVRLASPGGGSLALAFGAADAARLHTARAGRASARVVRVGDAGEREVVVDREGADAAAVAAARLAAEAGGRPAYVVVRRYRLGGPPGEGRRRVAEGLAPVLRRAPGFAGYHVFDAADGACVSVTLFETEAAARASGGEAAAWAEANLAGLVDGPPAEVVAGEVRLMAAG